MMFFCSDDSSLGRGRNAAPKSGMSSNQRHTTTGAGGFESDRIAADLSQFVAARLHVGVDEMPFDASDHRAYRRMHWMKQSIEKLKQIDFMIAGKPATVGQIAIKFVLAPQIMASCLPTMTTVEQIEEYAAVSEIDDIAQDELDRLALIHADNFGVGPPDAQKSSTSATGWVDYNGQPVERKKAVPGGA